MTENEAIKDIKECVQPSIGGKSLEVAIQALEEIQQYRAIGLTPTMVQDLIKSCRKHEKNALENAHIVDEYRAIGTVEEFKYFKERLKRTKEKIKAYRSLDKTNFKDGYNKALEEFKELREKGIPKKPKYHTDNKKLRYCPCCGSFFGRLYGFKHCTDCGQALDWND